MAGIHHARCLLVRDLYHILALYCAHLGTVVPAVAAGDPAPERTPIDNHPEERTVPFSEWLFEQAE